MKNLKNLLNEKLTLNRQTKIIYGKDEILNHEIKSFDNFKEMICSYLGSKVKSSVKGKILCNFTIPWKKYNDVKVIEANEYWQINLTNKRILTLYRFDGDKLDKNDRHKWENRYGIEFENQTSKLRGKYKTIPMDEKYKDLFTDDTNLLKCLRELKTNEDTPTEILELFDI